jgi:glucose dehydrogenase
MAAAQGPGRLAVWAFSREPWMDGWLLSTAMTYTLQAKQYIVLAAGGHGKLGTKPSDYVLAFALP